MFTNETIEIAEWNQRVELRIEQNENSDHPYVYILINNGVIAVDELQNHRTERHDNNLRTAAFMSAISYLQDAQLCLTEQMIHGANKEYNVPKTLVKEPVVVEPVIAAPEVYEPEQAYQRWTPADNALLLEMYFANMSYNEIAEALDRTEKSIGNRLHIYQRKMNLPQRRPRK